MFGFKLERTEETLTAHGGLTLLAWFSHGLDVRGLELCSQFVYDGIKRVAYS